MIDSTAITWPAVVCYSNQPELATVESATSLTALTTTAPFILIDYTGNRFQFQLKNNALSTEQIEPMGIDQLVTLAREHMAALDHCCVAKFHASSAAQIIDSLIKLDD